MEWGSVRPGVHTISGTTIVPTYRQGVPELAHLAGRLGVSTSSGTGPPARGRERLSNYDKNDGACDGVRVSWPRSRSHFGSLA